MSTTPQFEIPTDVRKIAEKSVEQVKTAISGYLHFLQRAVPNDVMGGSELSNKIFGYAERNVESAFEFAQRLASAGEGCPGAHQAAGGLHASANAGNDRASEGPERDRRQGADGEGKNPGKGWPVILIAATRSRVSQLS